RLGSGLLIRAPEVQLLPGPPAAHHIHTTSSIGQSAVLLSRRFAVQVRGRVPIALACYASAEASPLSAGRDGLDSRAGRQFRITPHRISSSMVEPAAHNGLYQVSSHRRCSSYERRSAMTMAAHPALVLNADFRPMS